MTPATPHPMKYDENIERSAELLRKALPLMSRQAAGLHPVAYAVWYHYVKQDNPPLQAAIDTHLAQHGRLDEASTQALYRRHIETSDPDVAQRVAERFQRVLSGMAESAALAGDETARFGSSLSRLSQVLASDEAGQGDAVAATLADTQQMQRAVGSLQQRLSESQHEIDNLREEVRRARHDALVDDLTGLANRRAFDQRMAACLAETAAHAALPPCLVVGDLDHFKEINDTYGHSFGDQVLRAVAGVMKSLAPSDALAARVGGEEFALLLPATALADAQALAEQLRHRISAARVRRQTTQETIARVTLSLGVTIHRMGESVREFCDRADQALYRSKNDGRDRVTVLSLG